MKIKIITLITFALFSFINQSFTNESINEFQTLPNEFSEVTSIEIDYKLLESSKVTNIELDSNCYMVQSKWKGSDGILNHRVWSTGDDIDLINDFVNFLNQNG